MNLGMPFSLGLPSMGPCLFAKVIVKSIFTKLLTLPNCALFVILIHFLDSVMVGMWSTL
jgi:hypothetical protein